MKKILALLIAMLMLLSAASALAEGTLVYGSGDYTRINPAIDEHGEINLLIFNGLTAHDADNNVVPCLAESWDYDEATHTYTFHLVQGVTFHDGESFTAEDVKFTIEAIMDPANESEIASNYTDVKEIRVVDDNTVAFELEGNNAAFLEYMTIGILPKHLLEGQDMQTSDYFRFPIGTGPYKLERWDEGQAITLVKNENYFLGAPNIDTVVFKIVEDDNVKALQLKSGELNMAQVTPKDAQLFEGDDQYAIYRMKTSDYRGILFNFWNPYWQQNKDLIPAINYAIDREAMIQAVLLGQGDVAYGPLQRNIYNNPDVEHYDYNPEKAIEILESIGCERGEDGFFYRNGEKISFPINCRAGDQVRIDLAQIASQQLKEVGIDMQVEIPASVDWGTQYAFLIGWGSPFDADDHTFKVFGTDQGNNYSGYSNADVDAALLAARSTFDSEARAKAYADFQVALANDPAYTFFCYIDADYVVDARVKGITADTVLGHHGVGIFWNVAEWTLEG